MIYRQCMIHHCHRSLRRTWTRNRRQHPLNDHSCATPTHQSCTDSECFLNLSIQHYPSRCTHCRCLYFRYYVQCRLCTQVACKQPWHPTYPNYHRTQCPKHCCSSPQQSHIVHQYCPSEQLQSKRTLLLLDKGGFHFSRSVELSSKA